MAKEIRPCCGLCRDIHTPALLLLSTEKRFQAGIVAQRDLRRSDHIRQDRLLLSFPFVPALVLALFLAFLGQSRHPPLTKSDPVVSNSIDLEDWDYERIFADLLDHVLSEIPFPPRTTCPGHTRHTRTLTASNTRLGQLRDVGSWFVNLARDSSIEMHRPEYISTAFRCPTEACSRQ